MITGSNIPMGTYTCYSVFTLPRFYVLVFARWGFINGVFFV